MSKTRIESARWGHRDSSGLTLRNHTLTAAFLAAALLGLAPGLSRATDDAQAQGIAEATVAATEQEQTLSSTAIGGLTLPEYIGPLEFIGAHSGPEKNISLSYSYRAMGMGLELSITDLGANGVADGVAAPQLVERYAEAKQDLTQSTHVRRLKPRHEANVSLGKDSPRFAREAWYTVKQHKNDIDGGTTYLLFTAAHGLVIDARFDVAPGFEEDGSITHGELLAALGEAIPASADTVVRARARAAAAAESAMKVAIEWDPATPEQESKIWLAYLFARAAYAANEKGGGPAVGERDASFEEEVRGRSIALSTFRELRRNDVRLASAYFSDIDRVDDAGFLREYVWSYFHRDSWAAPHDLDLDGFNAWRTVHLPNHVPVTHGRIAFRVAAGELPQVR